MLTRQRVEFVGGDKVLRKYIPEPCGYIRLAPLLISERRPRENLANTLQNRAQFIRRHLTNFQCYAPEGNYLRLFQLNYEKESHILRRLSKLEISQDRWSTDYAPEHDYQKLYPTKRQTLRCKKCVLMDGSYRTRHNYFQSTTNLDFARSLAYLSNRAPSVFSTPPPQKTIKHATTLFPMGVQTARPHAPPTPPVTPSHLEPEPILVLEPIVYTDNERSEYIKELAFQKPKGPSRRKPRVRFAEELDIMEDEAPELKPFVEIAAPSASSSFLPQYDVKSALDSIKYNDKGLAKDHKVKATTKFQLKIPPTSPVVTASTLASTLKILNKTRPLASSGEDKSKPNESTSEIRLENIMSSKPTQVKRLDSNSKPSLAKKVEVKSVTSKVVQVKSATPAPVQSTVKVAQTETVSTFPVPRLPKIETIAPVHVFPANAAQLKTMAPKLISGEVLSPDAKFPRIPIQSNFKYTATSTSETRTTTVSTSHAVPIAAPTPLHFTPTEVSVTIDTDELSLLSSDCSAPLLTPIKPVVIRTTSEDYKVKTKIVADNRPKIARRRLWGSSPLNSALVCVCIFAGLLISIVVVFITVRLTRHY